LKPSSTIVRAAAVVALTLALAAPAAAVDTRPEFVIAVLGDSYASGEGTPDVLGSHSFLGDLLAAECLIDPPAGRKPCHAETWWSENSPVTYPQADDAGWATDTLRCHRTSGATGPRGAARIQDRFPQVKVVVLDFACSGAQLTTGLLGTYTGISPSHINDPPIPPQIKALNDYVTGTSRRIDAVLMNAGGNDALFGKVIEKCIFAVGSCAEDTDLRDQLRGRLRSQDTPAFPDAEATLQSRYSVLDKAWRNAGRPPGVPGVVAGRPDEIYITSVPNPSRGGPPTGAAGNPQNYCDGSQTSDPVYGQVNRGEAEFIEQVSLDMNTAFSAAAARHGWIFVDGIFEAFQDHGICAGAGSFFRTDGDALRFQGKDLPLFNLGPIALVVPFLSAGVGHPTAAGFDAASVPVRDHVGEQVRMLVTPPTLTLDSVQAGSGFHLSWVDPSPLHANETRWELDLGSSTGLLSDGAPSGLSEDPLPGGGRFFSWNVQRSGEFTARVRGCRATPTGFYCGPFSNAIPVATRVPGTPVDVRRVGLTSSVTWTPAANSPAATTYEVFHGRYGPLPCPAFFGPGAQCFTGIQSPKKVTTSGTTFNYGSFLAPLASTDSYGVQVRACSPAGCSPSSPVVVLPKTAKASPVGTFALSAPKLARAGKVTPVELRWRTPGVWTDLERMDLIVRAGRKTVGTIRFTEKDQVLWIVQGKKQRFGHPERPGRISLGPLGRDMPSSGVFRYGAASPSVGLRLGMVFGKALRGKKLTFDAGGRNDSGRTQAPRPAGSVAVRP
jgi:hypothetical protein